MSIYEWLKQSNLLNPDDRKNQIIVSAYLKTENKTTNQLNSQDRLNILILRDRYSNWTLDDGCAEWCPHCCSESPIRNEFGYQECIYCGEKLLTCSLCPQDYQDCGNCPAK